MAERGGGWASLLSLFRLVHDGGGADPAYQPDRHGELFDPDAYPFLEGRKPGNSDQAASEHTTRENTGESSEENLADTILTNLPVISDNVVEKVLSRLLWLADERKLAQRLNYRSLDNAAIRWWGTA